MPVNVLFDGTRKSLNALKYASMYYDSIDIYCSLSFYKSQILNEVNVLVDDKVARIHGIQAYGTNDNMDYDKIISSLKASGQYKNSLKDVVPAFIVEGYKNSIIFDHYKQGLIKYPDDFELYRYLIEMASIIEKLGMKNEPILSGQDYYELNNNEMGQSGGKEFINKIPIFIPNFFEMSFEEILELKYYMKDELIEMQTYINEIPFMFSGNDLSREDVNLFLIHKINPAIKQLENKYNSLKIGLLRHILKELKKPFSYSPIISTIFADVPPSVAVLGSLGIILGDSYLEYKMNKKELELDPLYFAVKLNEYQKLK